MCIEQAKASAVPTLTDLNGHPLLQLAMLHLLRVPTPRSLWMVHDTWVRFEDGLYTIGADEPATWSQVRELLIESDCQAQLWTEE